MSFKVGMVSLGCAKNQVDAELMLAKLREAGFTITPETADVDIVIVNTCGFIEDAKKEAIENILEFAQLKKEGRIKAIIITGCLAERYREQVAEEFPEADVVLGIGANADIAAVCRRIMEEGKAECSFPDKNQLPLNGNRILTTPVYWAYLKIADGCDNCCTYCTIPLIRGHFRSRTMEDIVSEAQWLASHGTKEVVVIAQDTTRYGEDIYGKLMLPELLNRLCGIDGLEWIRLMYCYPDRVTDELLNTIAAQSKILPYIDIPLQHADRKILKAMNRRGSREELSALIQKIRAKLPNVVLRTTFITGFPGEGEEEFTSLAEFVKDVRFERLGCFAYSREEDTKAAEMDGQISEETKLRRKEIIMTEQYRIIEGINQSCIGKKLKVLVEGYDGFIKCYFGRSYMDAPEVDGKIFFSAPDQKFQAGDFAQVMVTDVMEYDLLGEAIEQAGE